MLMDSGCRPSFLGMVGNGRAKNSWRNGLIKFLAS